MRRIQRLLDFLKERSDVIGDLKDYYVRFEFQERGSAHAHGLFWVPGAPALQDAYEEANKLGLKLQLDEASENGSDDLGEAPEIEMNGDDFRAEVEMPKEESPADEEEVPPELPETEEA